MATKIKVRCIEVPSRLEFTTVSVTLGKVYDVKWVDHDDYEILDDDLKLRWYRQRFFVQVDWDVKDENPKTEQS